MLASGGRGKEGVEVGPRRCTLIAALTVDNVVQVLA